MMNAKLKVKSLACWFLIAATCPQVLAIAPFQAQNQAPAKSPVSANPTNPPNQAEPNNSIAVASRITDINTSVSGDRLNLTLNFASSDRPQVTYTRQGKSWVALLNGAQLQLGNGNASYAKANPAAGITSIEATQYAANKVQIRVNAADPATLKDLIKRQDTSDSLVFSLEMQPSATQPNSISSANAPEAGVLNSQNAPEANKVLTAQNTTANSSSVGQALFQPKVTITNPDGKTRVAQSTAQNSTPPSATNPVTPQLPGRVSGVVPPFRPIKTPPVGDIATTTAKLRADIVELGTAERVPRITLRNAPAIEVLTLIGRVAGLSVVSADSAATPVAGAAVPAAGVATATSINKPVSLDIENETAQDVFNNVLRITGLEANRIGNTVFVATKLPVTLRNLITKSYRLNQISVGQASAYLVGIGATRIINRLSASAPAAATATAGTVAEATSATAGTDTIPTPQTLVASAAPSLVQGLLVIGEERSNSLTLVGSPRQVEFAEAQLARLDTRKRQVSVNVRIVDVQLLNNQSFSSQFSFGVGDSFYTVRDGVAVANFGQFNPAPSSRTSTTSIPTITNPITGTPYIDLANPGGLLVNGVTFDGVTGNPATNPFQPVVTTFTAGTPGVPATVIGGVATAAIAPVPASITTTLASLFQYPTRFLQSLEAQVTSGSAKILTDPTLTVQEGESASVALTQEVPGGFTSVTNGVGTLSSTTTITPITKKAGLTLNIQIDRVDDNGFVNLSISPSVSAISGTTPNPGGGVITFLAERTLNSGKIRLRDGQTFILSGVIQDSDRETITKVPILGDLPIIGALFRGSNTQNTRSEVIIVVTPRIMDDSQNSTFGYTYQPGAETQKVLDSNKIKPQ
jgi:type IV pilus assembly protein PilQ